MFRRLSASILCSVLAVNALLDSPGFYIQEADYYPEQWEAQPDFHSAGPLTTGDADRRPNPHLPHLPPHHPPKTTNGTIYTFLSEDPEFSRLFKAVNISDEIVSVLNDTSTNVTFFAVPNHALPKRPPHRRHLPDLSSDSFDQDLTLIDIISILESAEKEGSEFTEQPDEEHLKKIVTAILSYHIINERFGAIELSRNTTYPTRLANVFGALKDEPLRLRFGPGLPFARVNYYSKVILPDNSAKNGVIHAINRPLLPPPSAFQTLFLLQQEFSIFTSAAQRSGLTDATDYRVVRDSDARLSTEGSSVVTAFVPSNKAFVTLPRKLQLYLFSPFGERALKKLLQYHIVPDIALFTDWVLNSTSDAILDQDACISVYPNEGHIRFPLPKPEIVGNYTLPTALEDHSLHALVVKVPIRLPFPRKGKVFGHIKTLVVNGQRAGTYDGVALNGALHVVDRLINPHHGRKKDDFDCDTQLAEHDDWEDWEEWLPAWAEN